MKQLKDVIHHYMPYGLICKDHNSEDCILNSHTLLMYYSESIDLFPKLRPLDLTKEIEHNGEKFVPYDKAKSVVSNDQWVKILGSIDLDEGMYSKLCDMPYWWFELLVSWHFDVFGLIESNQAIKKFREE